ncbi:uncharacterized protein LOC135089315 isoform X2 [Scylla paramamosain]|uniref:uncharacterized protein LOC135089315 isoform X2 n=1 Tax=Scylla paramamosain TaxID=85552 RepID=UPI003082FA98
MAYEKTDPDDSVVSEGWGRRRGGEHDPYFESVVTSREVFVVSDDDQEEEMMTEFLGQVRRCKLFHYHTSESPPEWKERSTGDIKILRNKQKVCPSQSKDLGAVSGGPNTAGPTWAAVGTEGSPRAGGCSRPASGPPVVDLGPSPVTKSRSFCAGF